MPAVAHEANAFVLSLSRIHVLRDVFAEVATDSLSRRLHRKQLGPTEPIEPSSTTPERPFGAKLLGCRPIVALGEGREVTTGSDISARSKHHEQMKMEAAGLLSLDDADIAVRIPLSEDMGRQGIKPAAGLFRAEDMVGKGQGQKAKAIDAVAFRQAQNVDLKSKGRASPRRGESKAGCGFRGCFWCGLG